MKKIFALFIAILYLAVSSGLAVEIHQCMGKIANFSFNLSKSDTCASCGMLKNSHSCCKDDLRVVKIQDTYNLLNTNYVLNVPVVNLHHSYYLVNDPTIINVALFNGKGHSPPGYPVSSLCILNCVFRV